MAMNFNSSSTIKTSDNGVWQGDDPLHFAFPLLLLQTIVVIFTTRVVAFVLAPLRQPTVVAEIVVCLLALEYLSTINVLFIEY